MAWFGRLASLNGARHASCSHDGSPVSHHCPPSAPLDLSAPTSTLTVPRSTTCHTAAFHAARGFTLIEMMVVVIIITVVSALAIPSVSRQLRDRRTFEMAQRIAQVYHGARMRAMGRGSAVMVRFRKSGTQVYYTVLEAQRGVTDSPTGTSNAACAALPIPSCLTPNWDSATATDYRRVSELKFDGGADYDSVNAVMLNSLNANAGTLDICFTPMGRAFSKTTGTLSQLTEAYRATVFRGTSTTSGIGRNYQVLILPTGAARVLQ
jgi:prepilin-type N-terminal cleavage/methylation domain-containing protein